jgi:hypothetical protein
VIELKHSRAGRYSGEGRTSKVTLDYFAPPHDVDNIGIEFKFDPGSERYRDRMVVYLEADDFVSLFKEMISHNRRAFLRAVGKALLSHPGK